MGRSGRRVFSIRSRSPPLFIGEASLHSARVYYELGHTAVCMMNAVAATFREEISCRLVETHAFLTDICFQGERGTINSTQKMGFNGVLYRNVL